MSARMFAVCFGDEDAMYGWEEASELQIENLTSAPDPVDVRVGVRVAHHRENAIGVREGVERATYTGPTPRQPGKSGKLCVDVRVAVRAEKKRKTTCICTGR